MPQRTPGPIHHGFPTSTTVLADVAHRLAVHADVTAALQDLVEATVEIVPGARWVSVTRGLDTSFVTLASTHRVATEADLLQYRLGTGPCIDAVIEASVFASDDLALDDRWSHFGPQAARDLGTRSVLSIRLPVNDRTDPNAGLNMYGDHIGAFDADSRRLADVMVTCAGDAIAALAHDHQPPTPHPLRPAGGGAAAGT